MRVEVYTHGKVSKPKATSAAGCQLVIDGKPCAPLIALQRPPHESPTAAQWNALALGIGVALANGATELAVYTPSVSIARALKTGRGGKYDEARAAVCAGWAIYWTRDRAESWSVEVRKGAEMPELNAALDRDLKNSDEAFEEVCS